MSNSTTFKPGDARLVTHGQTNTRTHKIWNAMKQRCNNPNSTYYTCYGGRGITVCDAWNKSFEAFFADMGEAPEGYDLDRIDNNRGYSKENCRWVTHKENCNNRRDTKYITHTEHGTLPLSLMAEKLELDYQTLYSKVHYESSKGNNTFEDLSWDITHYSKKSHKWTSDRKPREPKRHLECDGKRYSIAELAQELGASTKQIRYRITKARDSQTPTFVFDGRVVTVHEVERKIKR